MILSAASDKSIGKFLYWTALAGILGWAVWRRFSLPLEPIADLDIWGYLSPALLKLTRGEFVHSQGRNFVYPGFLFLLLRMFGDFRAIVIVQHLLGLAGGGLILMTWRRVRSFIASSPLGDRAHRRGDVSALLEALLRRGHHPAPGGAGLRLAGRRVVRPCRHRDSLRYSADVAITVTL